MNFQIPRREVIAAAVGDCRQKAIKLNGPTGKLRVKAEESGNGMPRSPFPLRSSSI